MAEIQFVDTTRRLRDVAGQAQHTPDISLDFDLKHPGIAFITFKPALP